MNAGVIELLVVVDRVQLGGEQRRDVLVETVTERDENGPGVVLDEGRERRLQRTEDQSGRGLNRSVGDRDVISLQERQEMREDRFDFNQMFDHSARKDIVVQFDQQTEG